MALDLRRGAGALVELAFAAFISQARRVGCAYLLLRGLDVQAAAARLRTLLLGLAGELGAKGLSSRRLCRGTAGGSKCPTRDPLPRALGAVSVGQE